MKNVLKNKWIFLAVVTTVGFAVDIGTKYLVSSRMQIYQSIPVFGSWLELFFVYNKGALFGLNPKDWFPGFPVNEFFYLFSALAIAILVIYYRSMLKGAHLLQWGIALIMPGALGNLFDRIAHPAKGVVDFIKVDLGFWPLNPWPIFNAADIYITIGVILIFVEFVREELRKKPQPAPASEASAGENLADKACEGQNDCASVVQKNNE